MKRVHLFEFMDLNWFPQFLRKIQTNILQTIMLRTKAFDYAIPYIESELLKDNQNTIIDLCSGASGPWLRLINKISIKNVNLILTDKFPNIEMFKVIKEQSNGKISYIDKPIDVLDISNELSGIKTIFTGFHHFKPTEVYKIIRNAKDRNDNICIFDYVPDKLLTIILFPITFIISFFQFYFLSFLVKPVTFVQILFTNILPVIPIIAAWDGFVSSLRKYSKKELEKLLYDLNDSNYEIKIGEDFNLTKATPMVYLIGTPSKK